MEEEWTNEAASKHYRKLAAQNRRMAAELLSQGKNNALTRDAVASLLQDARDNERIAKEFEERS